MASLQLTEIVDERMNDPAVLGRLACGLRSNDLVKQRHHDDLTLGLQWQNSGDFWRCIITPEKGATGRLAQVDLHENATIRILIFQPCDVTISTEEGFLCLTRYKPSEI